jgi:hypothetical protein
MVAAVGMHVVEKAASFRVAAGEAARRVGLDRRAQEQAGVLTNARGSDNVNKAVATAGEATRRESFDFIVPKDSYSLLNLLA